MQNFNESIVKFRLLINSVDTMLDTVVELH